MRGLVALVGAIAATLAWPAAATAQDSSAPRPAAAPVGPAAAAPAVGEEGPEVYYLQDDAGRLVPVPGFRYRDFIELFRLRAGLPAALEPPAAVLESLLVRCDLTRFDAAAGTCPVRIECTVRQTRAGWASLSLGLDGVVLGDAPRHDGPGRVVVDAAPDGGYRGWFDAPAAAADAVHSLVLEGSIPVEVADSRDTLAVRLPAATAATVELLTARRAPDVAVLPPPPGRPTVATAADGPTTVTVAGISGAVRIRLAGAGAAAAWESVPQSSVDSTVRIDGRSAFIDAAIRLENLGPDVETIDVSLPPRTVLRAVRPPATLVSRGGTADAPAATIAIERGRDGRAVVELECEGPVDPAGQAVFEAIGFAVTQVESWRQWGRVSLLVEGDWQAEWADRPGVRRIDPPPAARRPAFVAAFAYDALPASLPVRVRPRVSRVVVEPEYRYDVAATRVALAATLRVAARGAPVTAIQLDVDPEFDVDEVGPPGVVDVTAVSSEAGRVTIPFLQPLAGDAVIDVRGIRWIDRNLATLAWQLPVPRADVVAPASVVVTAASDIELMPDAAASLGLVRQAGGGRGRADGEAALAYRMEGARGTFAAARRFLARRVAATIDVRARIDDVDTEVAETIRLDVAHVPLETVDLSVPARVADAGSLEVRQGGVVLDPFSVVPVDAFPAGGGQPAAAPTDRPGQVVRVVLAEPLLGTGELAITFRIPTPEVPPQATAATDLPLTLPADARVDRQTISIASGDRLAVRVRGDGWRATANAAGEVGGWTAVRPMDAVPLAISVRERAAIAAVAEAAWLRSDVLPDRRIDTATYVLSGGEQELTLRAAAAADSCSVTLDDAVVSVSRGADGRFAATLPPAPASRRRIVEMRTTSPRSIGRSAFGMPLGLPERLRLEPPDFGSAVALRRFYWEILARSDEHVLGHPADWTSQQQWRLGPGGWRSSPVVDAAALAEWIRTTAGSPRPPAAAPEVVGCRAVFSGLGSPGAATLWLVPTWCAVLVASGTALAAGLVLAYVAAARRPAVVVPAVAALGLAAAAVPDLAPLAVQAAVPGAALSLLAFALRLFFDRGARPVAPPAAVNVSNVSASSLTRAAHAPSLVIAGSSLSREGRVTGSGRSST